MRHVLHKVNRRPTSVHSRLRGLKAFGKDGMPFRRARLQLLWDIAEATLGKNGTPTPERLEALKKALSEFDTESLVFLCFLVVTQVFTSISRAVLIPLKELGLPEAVMRPTNEEDAESFSGQDFAHGQARSDGREHSSPPITYLHIFEDASISLGIFILPARAQIPLHNHPGMTVLSRILYGKMHVLSYDWKQHNHRGNGQAGRTLSQQEVVTVYDRVFTPEDPPAVLFPSSGGNIHQFTALTDCAVLDLLSPPYSTDEGRDCTYYRPVPGKSPGSVFLENFEPPNDFVISKYLHKYDLFFCWIYAAHSCPVFKLTLFLILPPLDFLVQIVESIKGFAFCHEPLKVRYRWSLKAHQMRLYPV